MGLLDRIAPRKVEHGSAAVVATAVGDPVFSTKVLRKFLTCLTARESPVLLDLGPVVGSNVTFFGEQLGCKIFVEDVFTDLDRFIRDGKLEEFPAFLKTRFTEQSSAVDGILCWDIFDYLNRPSGQALADQRYTKYIVVDEVTLKHRSYGAARGRQASLVNRDIIRLFSTLRVSDSFLLQNNLREILFRKPAWEGRM
jgi:hypothetical protein